METPKRCPVCNKYGSKKHPLNLCGECIREGRMIECIISRCDKPAMVVGERIARYCERHLHGEEKYLSRRDFTSPVADEKHGYRQDDKEEFEIISDEFPIRRT